MPTELTVRNMKIGLSKNGEAEKQFPEVLVKRAQQYIINRLQGVWTNSQRDQVCSYDEAVRELTWDKSPGYPYYYNCDTKLGAMARYGPEIAETVSEMMQGRYKISYFSLTEKSELRPASKVQEGKTRVFMASPIHHLLASIRLFKYQNETLMDKRFLIPSTIGLQLPGPEFVRSIMSLGSPLNDGDVSGCDLRFKLRLARVIRNVRANFLPSEFHKTVRHLYDDVYAGAAVALGGVYRVYGNKSGWFNTGHDNTLMTWLCFIIASYHFYPDNDPEEVMGLLINGDDLVVRQKLGSFMDICAWLKQFNFVVEAEDWRPRAVNEVVYLSHHIEARYVPGFGSFVLAAGNFDKIISSLQWIKRGQTLTFEERCVAHLIGLRMCLFPWAVEFWECDRLLSHFLNSVVLTPFMQTCLRGRLSERDLAILHTRSEGCFLFYPMPDQVLEVVNHLEPNIYLVLKGLAHRQIKDGLGFTYQSQNLCQSEKQKIIQLNCNSMSSKQKNKIQKKNHQNKTKDNGGNSTVMSKNSVKQVAKEVSKLITSPPLPNTAQTVIQDSHVPVPSGKEKGIMRKIADKGLKFLKEVGKETLFTLGSTLLSSPLVIAQQQRAIGATTTTVSAGTILGYVDLYPNFADQLSPGTHTRLSRLASTFMRYRFSGGSCVNFEPAAGALINGQIGMFVTSDPRYEITATGQDAVRLIREFDGVISQISQPMCLPLPAASQRWLYVEDAHESDIRFTRQGTLWVLAATDLSFDPTALTALGEFNFEYHCELKDNSIDGAAVIPSVGTASLSVATTTVDLPTVNLPASSGGIVALTITPVGSAGIAAFSPTNLQVLGDSTGGGITFETNGTFTINNTGVWKVSLMTSCGFGWTTIPTGLTGLQPNWGLWSTVTGGYLMHQHNCGSSSIPQQSTSGIDVGWVVNHVFVPVEGDNYLIKFEVNAVGQNNFIAPTSMTVHYVTIVFENIIPAFNTPVSLLRNKVTSTVSKPSLTLQCNKNEKKKKIVETPHDEEF